MANRNIEALAAPLYIGNGSNRTKITTDGTLTLEGAATAYDDISGYINASNLYSTPGKVDYDYDEMCVILQPSGSLATIGDVLIITFQLKHGMKTGAALKLHIHWVQPSSDERQFTWKYRVQGGGAAKTTAWSADQVTAASAANNAYTYTSGNLNQITALGSIATTGIALSSIVQVKLARTDSFAGNLQVYDVDCHYEIDSFGSAQEYIK